MHPDDTLPTNDGHSGGPLGRAGGADPECIAERCAYRKTVVCP
jgi:hypothetical protein